MADVFKNLKKICLKIYHLKYFSVPGIPWQAALKKTEVKLELLADTDTLLMVETGIRGGIYNAIHQYAKVLVIICKIMISHVISQILRCK